jgi:fatty acid desaturase
MSWSTITGLLLGDMSSIWLLKYLTRFALFSNFINEVSTTDVVKGAGKFTFSGSALSHFRLFLWEFISSFVIHFALILYFPFFRKVSVRVILRGIWCILLIVFHHLFSITLCVIQHNIFKKKTKKQQLSSSPF